MYSCRFGRTMNSFELRNICLEPNMGILAEVMKTQDHVLIEQCMLFVEVLCQD